MCIVHLHAHDSVAREKEARAIVSILSPWLSATALNQSLYSNRVIVMGDFNTLSPWDAK